MATYRREFTAAGKRRWKVWRGHVSGLWYAEEIGNNEALGHERIPFLDWADALAHANRRAAA